VDLTGSHPLADHEVVRVTIPGVRLERATSGDTDALTISQLRSFDDDALRLDGEPSGGASGQALRAWNRRMVASTYYYKITLDDRLVGGAIVARPEWSLLHLARIWVEPSHQHRGIGSWALALLEARFRQATLWTADAPAWAYRRRQFLKRNGYEVTHESNGIVRYQKPRKGILRLNSLP
jgi:GNAT superfamily N-acetyltransferase